MTARRYWHTLKHLRARQVMARADLRVRAALRRLRPDHAAARYARRARAAGLDRRPDPWRLRATAHDARRHVAPATLARIDRDAAALREHRFTFLNETAGGGSRVDWTAAAESQLWRYHLHYFDYLPEALVAGMAWAPLADLADDWIRRNPLGPAATRDPWHSYVVSLRVVNWMLALAAADVEQPDTPLWTSLVAQVAFLEHNLETDVGGNHLLKNLKALAMAGTFFDGPGAGRLRARFVPRFTAELTRQVRADGGHYEQSPMYHVQVLVDAAEVALALRLSGAPVPEDLAACLRRMRTFLDLVCHPDGQIAQFGDSAFNMTPEPSEVRAAVALALGEPAPGPFAPRHALAAAALGGARDLPAALAPDATATPAADAVPAPWNPAASGFHVLASADRRAFLIADAGPVCPDDLPAHAHSDTFGFELSLDGTRIIVDTGVSEYRAGPWRTFERSTRAHNTVVVDAAEQSDCWGSFRVAERARIVSGGTFSATGVRGVAARHDGYERLPGRVRHTRQFALLGERAWIIVDRLDGGGTHRWDTHLHLHPEVAIVADGDLRWRLTRGTAALVVAAFGIGRPAIVHGVLDPPQGWYAPEFGRRLPAPVLTLSADGPLPATFGWLLLPEPAGDATATTATDGSLLVMMGGEEWRVPMPDPPMAS